MGDSTVSGSAFRVPHSILGWDIGAANLKAARLAPDGSVTTLSVPFELWREPGSLPRHLRAMAERLGPAASHAVTMTAELADCFATKREGVAAVLAALEAAFPDASLAVWGTDSAFHNAAAARANPLTVAAANWAATATWLARTLTAEDDGTLFLLLDVGSTTTDIVPIVGGAVQATGRTDPARLLSGELVYTGALRTNCAAIVRRVPLWAGECPVASELFAVSGDAHVWLGHLNPADYDGPTPDGRSTSREDCGVRLARLVCADREMLRAADLTAIAWAVHKAQVDQVERGLAAVLARHGWLEKEGRAEGAHQPPVAITTGLGDFLAAEAAARLGLSVIPLAERVGAAANRVTPALAVAALLAVENREWRSESSDFEP